ncbi:hypothetical protein K0M31_013557, partial [Melipona bicolor]
SEISARGDAVLQEGFDHPGGGLGAATRISQCDAPAPEVTTASGYAVSAVATLQTHQSSSFLRPR